MKNVRFSPLCVVLCAASLLSACSASNAASSGGVAPSTPSTSNASPVATPAPVNILSGRTGADGPVVAIKIDNTNRSLPHIGLTSADVVYLQQVEGGLTRLAAIYSSTLPKTVAPVRSARETDTELLPMYGPIAFGFSGSIGNVHAMVRKAGLVDVSADVGGKGYWRLDSRYAPYNEAAKPSTLIKRADGSVPARDVGFRFGAAPTGGVPARSVKAVFPDARVTFQYNPATRRYAYALGGKLDRSEAEGQVSPSTVIVQSVKVGYANRGDVNNQRVPFTHTVGSGNAVVLRNGLAYQVKWSRPSASSPTRWTYLGADFPMAAGQVWVVLLNRSLKPTLR